MTSLRELQQCCYRTFLLEESAELAPELASKAIPAATQIAVYQNNAQETFRKALLSSFPVVARLVGDDCLRGLARTYMREHPSLSGNLQGYGRDFPGFLDDLYGATRFSYLHDVARLEWALEEVHLEPQEPQLDVEALLDVAPKDHSRLTFKLRKASRLVSSCYPVLSIWRANQPGRDTVVDLNSGSEHGAVLRREDDVELQPLDHITYKLAVQLARGASLEALVAAGDRLIDHHHKDGELDLSSALQSLMKVGLVAGFSLADAATRSA